MKQKWNPETQQSKNPNLSIADLMPADLNFRSPSKLQLWPPLIVKALPQPFLSANPILIFPKKAEPTEYKFE